LAQSLSGEQPAGCWARFDHRREVSYALAKFAKAAITMIAMITVPPKKAIFGDRFIC
jgi:hypothetical protein